MDNLQELRDRINLTNPDEVQKLDGLERVIKRAMLTKTLGENDAMLMLRATLEDRIRLCDKLLSNDPTLDEMTRRDIFTKKGVYKWFLGLFTVAETRIENLGGVINRELKARKAKK